jgi:hypothetical protein
MQDPDISMVRFSTPEEDLNRRSLATMIRECPIPDDEFPENLGLFLTSKTLARIKFMDFLYQKILDLHGMVMDFGTRWGQNMALFSTFRGMYEPFNRNRTIVGFDTFEGFVDLAPEDGVSDMMSKGKYAVSKGYENFLGQVMNMHEQANPLGHVKKHEIIKGDARVELEAYLKRRPETIVSLAYFDMDLYEPTRDCLKALLPHLTKGSVIGFDELNAPECPGETVALREVLGLDRLSIRRLPLTSRTAYVVFE